MLAQCGRLPWFVACWSVVENRRKRRSEEYLRSSSRFVFYFVMLYQGSVSVFAFPVSTNFAGSIFLSPLICSSACPSSVYMVCLPSRVRGIFQHLQDSEQRRIPYLLRVRCIVSRKQA
jgi:hypothetical protein